MVKRGPRGLTTLVVRKTAQLPGESASRGHVKVGALTLACALGGAGIVHAKREGDRGTPAGSMRILAGYFRADRLPRPACRLALRRLPATLAWGDEPGSPLYNRPARALPHCGHETMWREDGLYDIVLVLDYNIAPRRDRRGSAIFLHCAKPGFPPTLGCIALAPGDLRRLLPRLSRRVRVVVV